jgi:hypothetical protein
MTTAELHDAYQHLVGFAVRYVLDGQAVFQGTVEYVTADLWAGIRQPHDGNRLDEAPVRQLELVDVPG